MVASNSLKEHIPIQVPTAQDVLDSSQPSHNLPSVAIINQDLDVARLMDIEVGVSSSQIPHKDKCLPKSTQTTSKKWRRSDKNVGRLQRSSEPLNPAEATPGMEIIHLISTDFYIAVNFKIDNEDKGWGIFIYMSTDRVRRSSLAAEVGYRAAASSAPRQKVHHTAGPPRLELRICTLNRVTPRHIPHRGTLPHRAARVPRPELRLWAVEWRRAVADVVPRKTPSIIIGVELKCFSSLKDSRLNPNPNFSYAIISDQRFVDHFRPRDHQPTHLRRPSSTGELTFSGQAISGNPFFS
ncbi:glycogen debranching enzyme [Striga asiatica]|uniref:Glycogen debranching enzyme n=1 Tax=Striga asiatica TaxID=4170 RepID=A0A5A7NXS5_STRAF|nr:glycogen debranching enzyme [Striga asiatica]